VVVLGSNPFCVSSQEQNDLFLSPLFGFNPYKFHSTTDKAIFGPPGIKDMVGHIVAAWRKDVDEMMTSHKWSAAGSRATATDVSDDGPEQTNV